MHHDHAKEQEIAWNGQQLCHC